MLTCASWTKSHRVCQKRDSRRKYHGHGKVASVHFTFSLLAPVANAMQSWQARESPTISQQVHTQLSVAFNGFRVRMRGKHKSMLATWSHCWWLDFVKYTKWGPYSTSFSHQEKSPWTVPPAEVSSANQTCVELLAHFIIRGAMARAYRATASTSPWVVPSSLRSEFDLEWKASVDYSTCQSDLVQWMQSYEGC